MRANNLREFFPERYPLRLEACETIDEVFSLVQDAVKEQVGVVRGGLELGLADLEEQDGKAPCALHPLNSNCIVINRKACEIVKGKVPGLMRAFLFHSLLHEYLTTIGLADENEVDARVLEISLPLFGKEHRVTMMAEDLSDVLPGLGHSRRYGLPAGTKITSAEGLKVSSL